MDTLLQDPTSEIKRLERCIRDLRKIMSRHAMWNGGDASQIARSLQDAVISILKLDFAIVHVNRENSDIEKNVRFSKSRSSSVLRQQIVQAIDARLEPGRIDWGKRISVPIGEEKISVVPIRLGLQAEHGMLIAGCCRRSFPTETEQLLLGVAASQASIGFKEARILSEHGRQTLELNEKDIQRTAEIAATNSAFMEEIAQRKRTEDELRASENHIRQIVESIPAFVVVLHPDGSIESANAQMLEYIAKSLDELKDWENGDLVHPDDLAHTLEVFTCSIASGSDFEVEMRIRRRDGAYRWFHSRVRALRTQQGEIERWYAVLVDTDQKRRAEEDLHERERELRRSEAFLAEGQRLSQTGTFFWNTETNEVRYSEESCRIHEIPVGLPVSLAQVAARIHPDDRGLLQEKIEAGLNERGGLDYEIRLQMPDKRVKWVRTIATGYRNEDGKLEYIGAVQDTTERHLAEESLSKLRSELTQLARASSLGALTASIAHEVNQPLAGIITNAGTGLRMLAADPPNVDGAIETARRTIRDANRASDVISRLRAMFSGKDTADEKVDLNEATQEVIALSLTEVQRHRVVLLTSLASGLPAIKGDRIQFQQVILNLILNASDSMKDISGRPREILVKTSLDANDCVRLSVVDSGVGITPDNMERIFEPFFTTKSAGMGIGLSVSRSIMERHRGTLWAEPNDGPGATFFFAVPAYREDTPPSRAT